MSDSENDDSFSVLPSRLRRRIDGAFNKLAQKAVGDTDSAPGPSRKKRKLNSGASTPAPGGFLVEGSPAPGGFVDEDAPGGFIPEGSPAAGGFIPESAGNSDNDDEDNAPSHSHHQHNHIPFSLVPTALQLLDLQPDDEDVLSVFRNAASGWETSRGAARTGAGSEDANLLVSRKDWRAVCAALLDTGGGAEEAEDIDMDEPEADQEPNEDDSGEGYVESQEDEGPEDDGSDDDYEAGGFVRSKSARTSRRGRTSTAPRSSSPLGSDFSQGLASAPRKVTARQKAESRRVFAMFFPDVSDGDLDKQKIMIKDITRVAVLLKEKLTAEEIIEMLEAFSSSPDKSMNLSDFERMMVAAKLA